MCGRFGRFTQPDVFARQLSLWHDDAQVAARYNTPPGEAIWAVAYDLHERSCMTMQCVYWGFIPSWADTASVAQINARSETAATKPFFRKAFHLRRCVIAADYWIEWRREAHAKQPYVVRPADGQPFFFAGIWSWPRSLPIRHKAAGSRTAAILTTAAAASIAHVHARMPVALNAQGANDWLAAGTDTVELQQRLVAGRHASFEAWPVSTRINRPSNDDAVLLASAE